MDKFQILAGLSRAQKKASSEFTEFSTKTGNIKFGHAVSFHIHRKIISQKNIKKILDISKAIRVFVFGNLSVLSIYSEVLG